MGEKGDLASSPSSCPPPPPSLSPSTTVPHNIFQAQYRLFTGVSQSNSQDHLRGWGVGGTSQEAQGDNVAPKA